jgi:hypothetical protein
MSVEEYINRIRPKITHSKANRHKFTIFNYCCVTTLNTGCSFGDLALMVKGGKRTATVITQESTHFGLLDKISFDNCLRSIKEKEIISKLNILCNMTCFCKFSKPVFNKKYLNLFVSMQSLRGLRIMVQGDIANKILFIKEGEYEVKFRRSLMEMNELLKEFGADINIREETQYMLGIEY